MANESDYEEARKFPCYRQAFLNKIDLEEVRRYVKKIAYLEIDHPCLYEEGASANMALCVSTWAIIFPIKKKSKIEVYPTAFSDPANLTLDDFLLDLQHEGFHARECFENPGHFHDSFRHFSAQLGNSLSGDERLSKHACFLRLYHAEGELRATRYVIAESVSSKISPSKRDKLRKAERYYMDMAARCHRELS
jgi:hypothetical protein